MTAFLTTDWMDINGKNVRFGIKENKYGDGIVLVGIAADGSQSHIANVNIHGLYRHTDVSDKLGLPLTKGDQKVISR